MPLFKEKIEKMLATAGISINGSNNWDIQVHDERLFRRIAAKGSMGLGEAYMDGWWDCKKPDEFFYRIIKASLHTQSRGIGHFFYRFISNVLNKQTIKRSIEVGERHYDIGNDLYRAMLDKRMVYSCGYWSGDPPAGGLDEAQENKLDLICRKLKLKSGQKVLDIGCGWGSFAKFAAEKYGVEVTGVTISKEQAALAKESVKSLPVEIKFLDYRKIEGMFDRIVSVGMFEHVGPKNYRTYMKVAGERLRDGGLFLLHTIGGNYADMNPDPWIEKYIFPNGAVPNIEAIGKSVRGIFNVEDWHNFGADYDKTLMAWRGNFEKNWDKLKERYSERFRRMWNYYLLSCAGSFRARDAQLWQIVLSKGGVPGGYESVR